MKPLQAYGMITFAIIFWNLVAFQAAFSQEHPRDLDVKIAVNQLGYTPSAAKQCVIPDAIVDAFEVVDTTSLKVAFSGDLTASNGDFGDCRIGNFTKLQHPGTYFVRAGKYRSFPFRIDSRVYTEGIDKILTYFSLQRCGPSTTGYLTPCHCDDAVRLDNGKHQDTTGGWHDASDLRKWVGATIHGMIGLASVYELTDSASFKKRIAEELRWGNRYFLNMQEPAGYVMSHVGGDALAHGDGNRWTDNVIGSEGGEARTFRPATGRSISRTTIMGDKDDRVIKTEPLDRLGQYKFIIAQAKTARVMKTPDAGYSAKCLEAGVRCYEYCRAKWPETATGNLGGALVATLELYRCGKDEKYKYDAIAVAEQLLTLQVAEAAGSEQAVRGHFRQSTNNPDPYRDIWHGCWHLFGLCDLVQLFPEHAAAETWRRAIRLYAERYLAAISSRNAFGMVPYGLFPKKDPGGNRRIGNMWYRYFMYPVDGWWVGVNANVASAGIGLCRAARVLDDPELATLAQRQMDWIVGGNPLCSSTLVGIGHNHPPQFLNGSEFFPPTPVLPGAVMNGLGGTKEDQPFTGDGIYNISEYWTPMVAYTVWLMAELQQ